MDPLSVTAGVIAVATAALQSAKALYDAVDGLEDAPHSVSQAKGLLSQTQTTLSALTRTLEANPQPGVIDSILKEIQLSKALESTVAFCQAFTIAIVRLTSHSTDSRFSKRDRFLVYFNESKMDRLSRGLSGCQRTITMALSSITLIVTSHASGNVDQLRAQFDAQEQALAGLGAQLSLTKAELQVDQHDTATEVDLSVQLTTSLQEVCQRSLAATRSQRSKQEFGDMKTDSNSIAMQGIVGVGQSGLDQSFGSLTSTMGSRAFQGQMDADSFGKLLGK